jgi:hypothetical protein
VTRSHEFYRKLGFTNGAPFGFESWASREADTMHLAVTEPDQHEARIRLADLISSKPVSSAGKKQMIKTAPKM